MRIVIHGLFVHVFLRNLTPEECSSGVFMTLQGTGKEKTMNSSMNVKKITTIGMLSALAFVVLLCCKIIPPIGGFLSFEVKDSIIAISGLLFGPFVSFGIVIGVCFVEMVTISGTGIIGFVMNALASSAFACTAAFIYKKKRTLGGAFLGLLCGCLFSTLVMLLWNYLLTPLYLDVTREAVIGMLVPLLLPFNLIKCGLNAALTLLLYRPVSLGLRKTSLLPPRTSGSRNQTIGVTLVALVLVATFILLLLVLMGKI